MAERKELGKIKEVVFCQQDGRIGFQFTLQMSGGGGVQDFWGDWSMKRTERCQWTENDRLLALGKAVMRVHQLLCDSKRSQLDDLNDAPIEVTLDGQYAEVVANSDGGKNVFFTEKGTRVARIIKGRILKLGVCTNGYLAVHLGAAHPNLSAHRLVAFAFVEGYKTGYEVNHKDNNRANNCASNLEWVSSSENIIHAHQKITRKKHALIRHVFIRNDEHWLEFASVIDAAKHLGVVPGSVASAATKNHRCKGYEVRYV